MDPVIVTVICLIAAGWAVTKTASAIRTLREQRRNSESWERGSGHDGSFGVGGIDPGGSNDSGHGGHGHGGGDCGGHGGGW